MHQRLDNAPCHVPASGRATVDPVRAPFPWFGGKSRAASLIWERFGEVANYVELFAGSLAVLLGRPSAPGTETVNDLDCNVANFWRAIQAAPDEVARWADWPVNEADLHARHRWLVSVLPAHRARMEHEPEYFDAKIAGWWVWGLCLWIGDGWCRSPSRKIPELGSGRGVHSATPVRDWFQKIQARLRHVRVACGDWSRVLGDSVTWRHGLTGILLDPPYADGDMEYAAGADGVAVACAAWARENGDNRQLRIALCGLEGEHDMPGWECVPWKARGGYGSQRSDGSNDNRKRERIWFSPHCLRPDKGQIALFGHSSDSDLP